MTNVMPAEIREWLSKNETILQRNPELRTYLGPAGDEKKAPKYHNIATEYGGRTYQSAEEAKYAWGLDMRARAGEIPLWIPQVAFPLPGGYKYIADFLVFDWKLQVEVVDTKGMRTRVYINKKKAFEAAYGIKIKEVNLDAKRITRSRRQSRSS